MKWPVLDMLIPAGKKTFISAGNYIAGSTLMSASKIHVAELGFDKALKPACTASAQERPSLNP